MPGLKFLTRRVLAAHEKDVVKLRALLNKHGYDADPIDIEAAYIAWSRDRARAEWHPLSFMANEEILLNEVLLKGLHEAPAVDVEEIPEPKPEQETDRAETEQEQVHVEPEAGRDRGEVKGRSVAGVREEKRRGRPPGSGKKEG